MSRYEKQQQAKARIETIESHTRPIMGVIDAEKKNISKRGAVGVALGVLAVGFARVGVDVLAVISAGSAIGATVSAVTRHMERVRPRDQYISGVLHEAQAIAEEADVDFQTDYVHPEDRTVGRFITKLSGKLPSKAQRDTPHSPGTIQDSM